MDLYIIYKNCVWRSEKIYLERCFLPNVGTYFERRVDPAQWFQTLVLDAVLVDCTCRNVQWRPVDQGDVSRDSIGGVNDVREAFQGKG